jgi:hypothetical protein
MNGRCSTGHYFVSHGNCRVELAAAYVLVLCLVACNPAS